MSLIISYLSILIVQIKRLWDILRLVLPLFHRGHCYIFVTCYQRVMWSLLQIQAAVLALRNTRGLPWPEGHKKKKDEDMLDWLQEMFGFQVILLVQWCLPIFSKLLLRVIYKCWMVRRKDNAANLRSAWSYYLLTCIFHVYVLVLQRDNVANQREHLILLLANVHIRQFPKPDQQPKVCTLIFTIVERPLLYRCGMAISHKLQFYPFVVLFHFSFSNRGDYLALCFFPWKNICICILRWA